MLIQKPASMHWQLIKLDNNSQSFIPNTLYCIGSFGSVSSMYHVSYPNSDSTIRYTPIFFQQMQNLSYERVKTCISISYHFHIKITITILFNNGFTHTPPVMTISYRIFKVVKLDSSAPAKTIAKRQFLASNRAIMSCDPDLVSMKNL